MDIFKMISEIYGFNTIYPKNFNLFNNLDSNYKFVYNNNEINLKANNIQG
jgi:hypothetical protein